VRTNLNSLGTASSPGAFGGDRLCGLETLLDRRAQLNLSKILENAFVGVLLRRRILGQLGSNHVNHRHGRWLGRSGGVATNESSPVGLGLALLFS
tara:strand:+ start:1311 stop:1595 length:285 start_codon:yes stop_codon:yes gene_type:complete